MMDFKKHIGEKSELYQFDFDQTRWDLFCKVMGLDPSQVKNSSEIPTAITTCRWGEFDMIESFGGHMKNVLHAEQEYVFKGEFRAGETLEYETFLKDVVERTSKGYKMSFLVFETPISTKRSGEIAIARSNLVYREKVE